MTTRRSFFKQLALSVAAISSAQVLIPAAADAFKWKRTEQWLWVPNPDYVNAPYEVAVIPSPVFLEDTDIMVYSRAMGPVLGALEVGVPIRMATPTGPRIPPYILKRTTEPHFHL